MVKSLCLSLLASFSQCLLLISGLSVYFDTLISAADFILTVFISLRVVFPLLRLVGVHTVRYAPQSAPNQWMFCFYVVNNTGCFLFGLLPGNLSVIHAPLKCCSGDLLASVWKISSRLCSLFGILSCIWMMQGSGFKCNYFRLLHLTLTILYQPHGHVLGTFLVTILCEMHTLQYVIMIAVVNYTVVGIVT